MEVLRFFALLYTVKKSNIKAKCTIYFII